MNFKRIWLLLAPTLVLCAAALTQSCGNGLFGTSGACGQSLNPFEFVPLVSCSPPTPTPGPPGPGITSVSLCPAVSSSASPTPCPSFTATSAAVGETVAFEAIALYSNGTTQDVTDAGTTFWSNSNPSVLAPAPTPSPSPGVYSAACPGTSVVAASLNSGLQTQQVTVSVSGTAASSCPTSSSTSPTNGAQLSREQTTGQNLPGLQWSFNARAPIGPTIIAAPSGTIYFTSTDGILHALSSSGQELWSIAVGGSQLLLDQNQILYAIGQQGMLEALDANGTTLWQLAADGGASALARGPQGVLYAAGPAGLLSLRDDGATNWLLPGVSGNAMSVAANGEIIVGAAGGAIYGVAPNGQESWSFMPAGGFAGALAADTSGNVYGGSAGGVVYALNSNGGVAWEFRSSGPIVAGPIISGDGTIDFVADRLYALNRSGQLAWQSALASGSSYAVMTATDLGLLLGESGGVALMFGPDAAAVAALRLNGAISSLAASPDGQIYLGSQNGYLYAVK
jgi:hypothetical protein